MFRRCFTALTVAGMSILVFAGTASAHVSIQPNEATQGGYATEFIQVPNERPETQTTMVEVTFPSDHPLRSVRVEPVPGWTIKVDTAELETPIKTDDGDVTEAVSKITWSGGQVMPGQFVRFPISIGPLPKVASLEFKAVQTYSDGEIVRWTDTATPGGPEPEHPAPLLKLKAAAAETKPTTATTNAASGSALSNDAATSDDVDSAKTIGIIGIVVGALGVLLAIGALARKRNAPNAG